MLRLIVLLVLFVTPLFTLAQESGKQSSASREKELQRYQERYTALRETFTTTLDRNLDSNKKKTENDLLMEVNNGLLMADSDLFVLQAYLFLADMITEKQFTETANNFVRSQYGITKRKREVNIQYIERTLHASRDQETTRLLLEARDLHRAVAEYLGRIDDK